MEVILLWKKTETYFGLSLILDIITEKWGSYLFDLTAVIWCSATLFHLSFNPILTGHGRNQPIYERHVTKSGRNRVNKKEIGSVKVSFSEKATKIWHNRPKGFDVT